MQSVLCLLLILFELSWRCFGAEPIIVPQDEFTQAGCNVTIKCAAENPLRIEWSTRRTDFRFTNSPTRFTSVTMDGNITTAILSFINIQPEDGNEYSCITIFPNGDSDVKTIRVIVDPEPITIQSVRNYTVDNVAVGNTITVACVIKSDCGTPNVVNFTNEQGIVLASFQRDGDGAFNWNPMVDNDLNGAYYCVAQNPLGTATQQFMITGTPLPRPPSGGDNGAKHTSSLLLVTMLLPLLAIIYN